MTFWDFVSKVWAWLEDHTTRIIAVTLGTVTTLVGTSIIPEYQLKYYAAAISILTYWRAQSVSQTVTQAKQIVKATNDAVAATPLPPSTGDSPG